MISNPIDSIIQNYYTSIHLVTENIACYCKDPALNFTRHRKLPADTVIDFLVQMQSKACKSEISDYFKHHPDMPSDSALYQQRAKLDPCALKRVYDLFTRSCNPIKTWKGYSILAFDGSDINIPFDIHDEETLVKKGDQKPYNQYHLNALYDALNEMYWNVEISTATKTGECDSFVKMVDHRVHPENSIVLLDRGFESYNLFSHCIEKNQKFIVRVKDIKSNGILSSMDLPKGEWDWDISKILTRKQNKEVKANPEKYKILPSSVEFDYLDFEHEFYELNLRVVRIKITEGTYECLITNLSREEVGMEEMKELYHLRWNEETSFRTLKYNLGLVQFHSKKRDFIQQEIYARLILYNLSKAIVNAVNVEKQGKKYELKANYAAALTNIRLFLRKEINIEILIKRIKKFLVPIRPERSYQRKMKPKCAVPLAYKAS